MGSQPGDLGNDTERLRFSEYADPAVTFELDVQQHNSKRFVVLRVREFSEIPVLCKKSYEPQ